MSRSPDDQKCKWPERSECPEYWTLLSTPWLLLLLSYEGPPTKGPPLLSHIVQQSQVHEHNNALQTPNFPLPVSKGHIKTLEADKRPLYGFFLHLSFSSPVILLLSTLCYYIQNPHNIDLNKIRHQHCDNSIEEKIQRKWKIYQL